MDELYSFDNYMGVKVFVHYEHTGKYYGEGYANGNCLYKVSGHDPLEILSTIKQQIAEDLVYD